MDEFVSPPNTNLPPKRKAEPSKAEDVGAVAKELPESQQGQPEAEIDLSRLWGAETEESPEIDFGTFEVTSLPLDQMPPRHFSGQYIDPFTIPTESLDKQNQNITKYQPRANTDLPKTDLDMDKG